MLPVVQKRVPSFFPPGVLPTLFPRPSRRLTAGDGNIPASNTSALLYARTRACTETIHPRHATPNVHPPCLYAGSASRRPATGLRGSTYTRSNAGGNSGRGWRRGWLGAEVLKLADRSLVMAVRSSLYREFK